MNYADLDTPSVLIDHAVALANLEKFQRYLDEHRIAGRPHIKTHKLPYFAKQQLALGAKGITCQKVTEAEVMVDGGLDDILITFNLVGRTKLERLRALARRAKITVVADNDAVVEGLAETFRDEPPIGVMVECDTGAGRNGVTTPDQAVALAQHIARSQSLSFKGLMSYPKKGAPADTDAFFAAAMDGLRLSGLEAQVLSGGGTPDMWRAHESRSVNEYRAGTYIYHDRMTMAAGAAQLSDCALTVLATVVSRPTEDRAILDTGSKSLAADRLPGGEGHGHIVEYPEAVIHTLNEEHGIVDLSQCRDKPRIGDKVRVIPNHACVVSNLFDRIWLVEGERVLEAQTVAARGTVQ